MGMSLGSGFKARVKPEMNVAPLVDVVLVLLIIFMVLAPVMTEAFNVRLPPKDDTDEQLDVAADPKKPLVLTVKAGGAIDVNGVELEPGELEERLRRMFNARPDNLLYVDADDSAPYGGILTIIDGARFAGAHPVVMVTKKLE